MLIKTADEKSIRPFLTAFNIPKADSHKGQNGRVLIIGGSSLFHSASIWAAEVASFFVDMVHYSSTKENNEIFLSLKKKFRNGIVIPQKRIFEYAKEDDAILIGPGMIREMSQEMRHGQKLIKALIEKFPGKRFVFDAGALQTMSPEWLKKLKMPAILTPQAREFEKLFGISLQKTSRDEKVKLVEHTAKNFNCVVVLKTVYDVISDGENTYVVEGGNQGLTKGGTGDLLAGLALAFCAKNDPLTSAILASYLLNKTAETLSLKYGYWYNVNIILGEIPKVFFKLSRSNL